MLLRRFFSSAQWRIDDDTALAAIVGPGSGSVRAPVSDDLTIVTEFRGGRLRVDVEIATSAPIFPETPVLPIAPALPDAAPAPQHRVGPETPAATAIQLVATFALSIVPEAGPQARIVRFLTGPGTGGQSGWIRDADTARDRRV